MSQSLKACTGLVLLGWAEISTFSELDYFLKVTDYIWCTTRLHSWTFCNSYMYMYVQFINNHNQHLLYTLQQFMVTHWNVICCCNHSVNTLLKCTLTVIIEYLHGLQKKKNLTFTVLCASEICDFDCLWPKHNAIQKHLWKKCTFHM